MKTPPTTKTGVVISNQTKAPYQCVECDYTAVNRLGIVRHWHRIHGAVGATLVAARIKRRDRQIAACSRTSKPPFECNVKGCDYTAMTMRILSVHQHAAHGFSGGFPPVKSKQALTVIPRDHEPEPAPEPKIVTPTPRVNFCPQCGCSIRAVDVALNLSKR